MAGKVSPFYKSHSEGFTLIEVMVVLTIIAAITGMIIPRISNKNNQMKAAVRHLTVLSKEIHNHARLYGATYRIVIDMKEGVNSDEQAYWVESSSKPYLVPKDKESILEEFKEKSEEKDEDEDEEKEPSPWQPATRLMNAPKQLPGSLKFSGVEVKGLNQVVRSGKVYIHFFPQGLVEEAVIQLSAGESLNWSVFFHPLTGKAQIVTQKLSLKDMEQ